MTSHPDDSTRCPSAPATDGALLIGVVAAGGRVVNLGTPLPVDASFIEAAKANGAPEQRFRFSSPCQQARCLHWANQQCGLIGQLHAAALQAGEDLTPGTLPRCAIRAQCRWWLQRGREACTVCPLVVTDTALAKQPKSAAPRARAPRRKTKRISATTGSPPGRP